MSLHWISNWNTTATSSVNAISLNLPTIMNPYAASEDDLCARREHQGLACNLTCKRGHSKYCNVAHGPNTSTVVKEADKCVKIEKCSKAACPEILENIEPFKSIQTTLFPYQKVLEWRLTPSVKTTIASLTQIQRQILLLQLVTASASLYVCALYRQRGIVDCIAKGRSDTGHHRIIGSRSQYADVTRSIARHIAGLEHQSNRILQVDLQIETAERRIISDINCFELHRRLYDHTIHLPKIRTPKAVMAYDYIYWLSSLELRYINRIPEAFRTGQHGQPPFNVIETIQDRLELQFKHIHKYHMLADMCLHLAQYLLDNVTEGDVYLALYYATYFIVGLLEVLFIQYFHRLNTSKRDIKKQLNDWRRIPIRWMRKMNGRLPTMSEGHQYFLFVLDSFTGFAELNTNLEHILIVDSTMLEYLWCFRSLLQQVETPFLTNNVEPDGLIMPEYCIERISTKVPALSLDLLFNRSHHHLVAPHMTYWAEWQDNKSILCLHQAPDRKLYIIVRPQYQRLSHYVPNRNRLTRSLRASIFSCHRTIQSIISNTSSSTLPIEMSNEQQKEISYRLWNNFLFYCTICDKEDAKSKVQTLALHPIMEDYLPRESVLIGEKDVDLLFSKDWSQQEETTPFIEWKSKI